MGETTAMSYSTWAGMTVGQYHIESEIGGGPFSAVYRGRHRTTHEIKAFKVARSNDEVVLPDKREPLSTQALMQVTGSLMPTRPDTQDLLKRQADKLRSVTDPGLLSIEDFVEDGVLSYYRYRFLDGHTLREEIASGTMGLRALLDAAHTLERLRLTGAFQYHGDLKPENILITPIGTVLIDPGYFGPITTEYGAKTQTAITTPGYYPLMQPDDLLALGIILFETVTGEHPLRLRRSLDSFESVNIGDKLEEFLTLQESTGNFYLSNLAALSGPASVLSSAELDPALEAHLLRAIRLKRQSDGSLELDAGYESIEQFAGALDKLTAVF